MKRILILLMALAVSVPALAATGGASAKGASNKARISLAAARRHIDKAVSNPAVMKAIMKGLSTEDQKQFVSDVNAAIKSMPGSEADRVATFVAVNRAALEGAQQGNVATLVAESFATVSPNALPALSESLSKDLLSRTTGSASAYSEDQYVKLGQIVMAKVNPRAEEVDHSDVRSGFAALMFVLGAKSEKAEIVDAMVATLPTSAQQTAKTEWFPAALAKGDAKSYDSMLAAADVDPSDAVTPATVEGATATEGEAAVETTETAKSEGGAEGGESQAGMAVNGNLSGIMNLRVSGPMVADSLIADVAGASTDPALQISQATPVYDAVTAPIAYQLPNLGAGEAAADAAPAAETVQEEVEEAKGYQWEQTH